MVGGILKLHVFSRCVPYIHIARITFYGLFDVRVHLGIYMMVRRLRFVPLLVIIINPYLPLGIAASLPPGS